MKLELIEKRDVRFPYSKVMEIGDEILIDEEFDSLSLNGSFDIINLDGTIYKNSQELKTVIFTFKKNTDIHFVPFKIKALSKLQILLCFKQPIK